MAEDIEEINRIIKKGKITEVDKTFEKVSEEDVIDIRILALKKIKNQK